MNLFLCLSKYKHEELPNRPLLKSLGKGVYTKVNEYTTFELPTGDLVVILTENTTPIGKAYNKLIKDWVTNKYQRIVFVHDDVIIEDRHLEEKLENYLKKYDIIGLAGGIEPQIKAPALWHLMCKKHFGTVGHFVNNNQNWYGTTFGVSDVRVAIVDGVFIGVNRDVLEKRNLRFDEDLPHFHHYDILFCLEANAIKLKIGVVPILITHLSPGLTNVSKAYLDSEKVFLNKASRFS